MNIKANEVSEVIVNIKAILNNIPAELKPGRADSEWTKLVFLGIGKLGQSLGWEVYASKHPEDFKGEWLYDLVWLKNDDDGRLSKIGLVLESEWNLSPVEIKNDFEKLLVIRAPLKVMVCQSRGSDVAMRVNEMRKGIAAFPTPECDEIYLLAVFDNQSFSFEIFEERAPGKKFNANVGTETPP